MAMAMALWPNTPILMVVGIYHDGVAAVTLYHGELGVVVDTYAREVPAHAVGSGMEAGVASGELGAAVSAEEVASGEQGAVVNGEQEVASGEQVAAVCGDQEAASETAVGHSEPEVAARDEQGVVLVELRDAAGGVRGGHGAWMNCHGPGGHGACEQMHSCGTPWEPLLASSLGGDASRGQIHCGMLVVRPATPRAGGASRAQVHGTPSLVPPQWQPGPAGRCRKAAMHHQRMEPVPELLQLTMRHCSRTAAPLQERGEEPCSSCLCW